MIKSREKMEASQLVESFSEFARKKKVDQPTMIRILDDVFRAMIKKKYTHDDNFDIIINTDNGDIEILRMRTVVDDDSEDIWDHDKISLSEAKRISEDFEIDEEVAEDISLDLFGRRAVVMARQALAQKLKNLEKEILFHKYKDLVGEIVSGEVYQILNREVLLLDADGNELSLPKAQQIPRDRFRKSESIRAIVHSVEIVNGIPRIALSRTSPMFLERLFENEVPEVYEGVISIKKVVRDPGERAKVAVESYDDRIDPVGACVGIRGSRIHSIVRELCNENIDVINYTDNKDLYISRALSPAKITSINMDEASGRVEVCLKPDQVSLALGKRGQNIRLASQLVDMEVDIFREMEKEGEEDVDIKEFADEIDEWIIEEFRKIGLDTAKSILAVPKEDLIRRADLEEETVEEVFKILRKEFE